MQDRIIEYCMQHSGYTQINEDKYRTLFDNVFDLLEKEQEEDVLNFSARSIHSLYKWKKWKDNYTELVKSGTPAQDVKRTVDKHKKSVKHLLKLLKVNDSQSNTIDLFVAKQIQKDIQSYDNSPSLGVLSQFSDKPRQKSLHSDLELSLMELDLILSTMYGSMSRRGKPQRTHEKGLVLDLCHNFQESFKTKISHTNEDTVSILIGEFVAVLNDENSEDCSFNKDSASFKYALSALKN